MVEHIVVEHHHIRSQFYLAGILLPLGFIKGFASARLEVNVRFHLVRTRLLEYLIGNWFEGFFELEQGFDGKRRFIFLTFHGERDLGKSPEVGGVSDNLKFLFSNLLSIKEDPEDSALVSAIRG